MTVSEAALPTGGGWRGYPYAEEGEVVDYLFKDMVVLGLWDPHRIFVFKIHVIYTDAESYDGIHPPTLLSQNERRKRGKHIEDFLDRWNHLTTRVLSLD